MHNGSVAGGLSKGTADVQLRRGVVGEFMAEWDAYLPVLVDFVEKVSNKLVE